MNCTGCIYSGFSWHVVSLSGNYKKIKHIIIGPKLSQIISIPSQCSECFFLPSLISLILIVNDIRETDIELIELKRIKGDPQINQNLKIRANQDVFELRRVLGFGRTWLIYAVSYLPYKLLRGLDIKSGIKKIPPIYFFGAAVRGFDDDFKIQREY